MTAAELQGLSPLPRKEEGKSLPSQRLDAGEGGVRRGDNANSYMNGNACHSF